MLQPASGILCNTLYMYIFGCVHTYSVDANSSFMCICHCVSSIRSAESWMPICLPKFNDTGFLHAYVSYLPNDSPACLLLISTDKEKFFALQEVQKRIVEVSIYTHVQCLSGVVKFL